MWILLAVLSSFFAGVTSVLAKCGIKKTDSAIATAIRTGVVLLTSFLMVAIVGSFNTISQIDGKSWLFLVLSGLSTGASWLCYFRALSDGDINKVVPIDKSSTVLTIILSFIFLGDDVTAKSVIGVILIAVGTFLMIEKKDVKNKNGKIGAWFIFAIFSALFASLTSILGKIGIDGVESNLGTSIRTAVVLVMAWIVVFAEGKGNKIKCTEKKELLFICLSGLATGASWLCYYKALKDGITSVVVPIDKLSIIFTIAFSFFFFNEKLSKRSFVGLLLTIAGTVAMIIQF